MTSLGDAYGRLRPALLVAAVLLAACAPQRTPVSEAVAAPPAPTTDTPQSGPVVIDDADESGPKTEIFAAEAPVALPGRRGRGTNAVGDVNLDFADADVREVARAVLGDILKVPFTVDPQLQGRVTLKTANPLRREDVVAALEASLRAVSAVVLVKDGVYSVVPAADAQKRTPDYEVYGEQTRLPGYGVAIVPLKYIAAAEMKKVLEPMAPAGAILNVDETRNLMFLVGTSQERDAMLNTVRVFDVDYMRGMSYALVHPEHMDAPSLAQELARIFGATRGPSASVVRFVPLTRVNTLLVAAPSAALIKDVARWVNRLDVPPRGPGRRIYYYRLQYARAEDVARSLASVYGTAVDLSTVGAEEEATSVDGFSTGGDVPPPPDMNAPIAPPPAVPVRQPSAASGERAAKGPHIAIDQANNALMIRADGTEYASIERLLREVDVAPDQVMIEVLIAEVTLNDTLKYGVEWFFKNADQAFNLSKTGTVAPAFPGFAFTYKVPDVDVALNALGSLTDVKVISSPKLFTLNNKPAVLQVGDQVPIITQSATGVRTATDLTVVNAVQLRDTGILLRVTPRIAKSGAVFVEVRQEVSNAIATETSGIDSPTIQQRKLATTVAVQDGASIALGGLIRDTQDYSDSGVPFLKDVPVLGKLFGTTTAKGAQTELLIFLRPRIIRNPEAAREMTDELKRGFRGLENLLGEGRVSQSHIGGAAPR
jgi:general secretion pathway protein D